MSKSRRRTPIAAITTASSDKQFKKAEHRRERRAVRVSVCGDDEPPHPKSFGDPWNAPKDGKMRFSERAYPSLMRK